MKHPWTLKCWLLLPALFLGFAGTTGATMRTDFIFENDTEETISKLYVSPHAMNQWDLDAFAGLDRLEPGEQSKVYWKYVSPIDAYDLKVYFRNGEHMLFNQGLNLSTISMIRITRREEHFVLDWDQALPTPRPTP